jgi:preprotein translocase subunit SecE
MAKAVAEETSTSLQPRGSLTSYVGGMWGRTGSFLSDVRGEIKKVVAPTREEVQSTTIVVLVTVAIFTLYFYALDSILGRGITWMLHKLSGQ